uniref:Uncharacterized protein n=1 Tax=Arundo donax TaxID=35708 RepID=A0A0A9BXW8_ARUDO
MTIVHLLCCF